MTAPGNFERTFDGLQDRDCRQSLLDSCDENPASSVANE